MHAPRSVITPGSATMRMTASEGKRVYSVYETYDNNLESILHAIGELKEINIYHVWN